MDNCSIAHKCNGPLSSCWSFQIRTRYNIIRSGQILKKMELNSGAFLHFVLLVSSHLILGYVNSILYPMYKITANLPHSYMPCFPLTDRRSNIHRWSVPLYWRGQIWYNSFQAWQPFPSLLFRPFASCTRSDVQRAPPVVIFGCHPLFSNG